MVPGYWHSLRLRNYCVSYFPPSVYTLAVPRTSQCNMERDRRTERIPLCHDIGRRPYHPGPPPFRWGFVLGLLSYKPHLTTMIPLALIAGRYWRALFGFAIGGAVLILASIAVFGSSVWVAFIQNIPFAVTHWQSAYFWPKMPSIYALSRFSGAHAWSPQAFRSVSQSL